MSKPWLPVVDDVKLKGIVGVQIRVGDIQCKFKLNQNRSDIDRAGVISHLEEQGSNPLADAMRENK